MRAWLCHKEKHVTAHGSDQMGGGNIGKSWKHISFPVDFYIVFNLQNLSHTVFGAKQDVQSFVITIKQKSWLLLKKRQEVGCILPPIA